jgi:hypothetical protein
MEAKYSSEMSVATQQTTRRHIPEDDTLHNHRWFFLKLFLRPWRWWRYVPPKLRLQLNILHGVASQKMILFITTAVKTSNLTHCTSFVIRTKNNYKEDGGKQKNKSSPLSYRSTHVDERMCRDSTLFLIAICDVNKPDCSPAFRHVSSRPAGCKTGSSIHDAATRCRLRPLLCLHAADTFLVFTASAQLRAQTSNATNLRC